jgi:hypothetical protein
MSDGLRIDHQWIVVPAKIAREEKCQAIDQKLRGRRPDDDPKGAWAAAGWLLGSFYARWCTDNMAKGAAGAFADRQATREAA